MPLLVDRRRSGFRPLSGPDRRNEREVAAHAELPRIDIGLLNNMPDAALQSTERQFIGLLDAAAPDLLVRLRFYALAEMPREDFGRTHVETHYRSVDELTTAKLDGLIVTGTEPRALDLRDEPYWGSLTRVLDWAEDNTLSSIWSCLAAHVALLHLDGIDRRPLGDKSFGIFDVEVADHPLTRGAPPTMRVPHSRWNGIPQETLTERGYVVLTNSPAAGVDTFAKERKSLLLFFQGHPEYETWTLMLEYRRDIGRWLRGERETYPTLPHGYFDDEATAALAAFREAALATRDEAMLSRFPTALVAERLANTWRMGSVRLYANWLASIRARKAAAASSSAAASSVEVAS